MPYDTRPLYANLRCYTERLRDLLSYVCQIAEYPQVSQEERYDVHDMPLYTLQEIGYSPTSDPNLQVICKLGMEVDEADCTLGGSR